MKLAAGNPNLMKAKALKVNKEVGLGTFATTLGDVARRRKHRPSSVYVPKARDPEVVPAPAMNLWERPRYVPEAVQPMRPGADDHMKFKSRGF